MEIIEDDYPSIEFKSDTNAGLEMLLDTFNVKKMDVIIGPSVVAVKDLLKP